MNRRSFIRGILVALAAPAILVPKARDHARWRVRRYRGLYIAEFKYVYLIQRPEFEEMFLAVREPPKVFQCAANPLVALPPPNSAGSWRWVEWHGPPSEVLADCST